MYSGASKDRLSCLGKKFLNGEVLKEKRGGRIPTKKDEEITMAVKKHIGSYYCRESHYSRSKCSRSYLPPELNITRMWKAFKENIKSDCSLSKYKRIFYKNFNLGFGNPHEDTCFVCKKLIIKIKRTADLGKKNELRT